MALFNPKSVSDLIAMQIAKWQELQENINVNSDSVVYLDAAVMAELIYMAQQDAITMANNAFLAYATGDELSNLGADRGIDRQASTVAAGVLTFGRATKAAANYSIASGTKVSTQPDVNGNVLLYKTVEDAVLYGTVSPPTNVSGSEGSSGSMSDSTQYHYKITALDGNGVETTPSDVFTILTSGGADNKSVDLTWTASPRASQYNIYVASGVGQEDNVHLLDSADVPFYTDLIGSTISLVEPPETNDTGALTVDVDAESVEAGSDKNVGAMTIIELVDRPTGIEYVQNDAAFSGGADEEDDVAYRARIRYALANNYGKATEAGYKKVATDVVGVRTASLYLPYPSGQRNEVWVYITGDGTSAVPSEDLIDTVQVEFDAEENRIPTINVTVKAPSAVPVNITVEILEYTEGFIEADVQEEVEANLEDFLADVAVGETVRVVDLQNVVHDTNGVVDFEMTAPTVNVVLGETEMIIPGTITVT